MRRNAPRTVVLCATTSLVLLGVACATVENGDAWSTKAQSTSRGNEAVTAPDRPAVVSSTSTTPADATTATAHASAAPNARSVPLPMPTSTDAAALRGEALAILGRAARSEWSLLRANAIEALAEAPEELEPIGTRALVDPNRGVRFVAAMTLAKAKRCDEVHLVEPLLHDSSESVRAAAIAALVQCGHTVDQSPLGAMVLSDDPEVRGNAFLALGVIGNPSATGLIRSALGKGFRLVEPSRVRVVELQAAEALVRLGETEEIEPIRAALFAPAEQGEITALACQITARLHDERSRPLLERIVEAQGDQRRAVDLRLAAIAALGQLGSSDIQRLLSEARVYLTAPEPGFRAHAAHAIGALGLAEGLPSVGALLRDRDPSVRVAAAGAVLELTTHLGATVEGSRER